MVELPLEDREYPEPDEDEDEDVSETLQCPECGKLVYEDSEQCPHCRQYVTMVSSSALSGRSKGFFVLAVLGILAVIVYCVFVVSGGP